jgi:peptidoglycan/xylan/chitin deacetylase (PgdA/CDA1 family)
MIKKDKMAIRMTAFKKVVILLVGILPLIFISDCGTVKIEESHFKPGVAIMFDDDYVDEWSDVYKVLKPYGCKCTFFVTKFNKLSPEKIQKLQKLKGYGNEVGGHGLNHLNAVNFISENGMEAYLNQEIYPMKALMQKDSLSITSFAYPYGSRNSVSDSLLLMQFKVLVGATYGDASPRNQNCYYKSTSRVVLALGIDNSYSHYSLPYFISLLKYARDHKKIVLFYGHKPVEMSKGKYQTEYKTLIEICQFVKNNNMRFYKISELDHL